MKRTMFLGKIHRATVTDADIDYEGSISIDLDLLDAAGILVHEKVHVLDIDNGNRFETYTIEAPRGSGEIGVNGAAARLVQKGDKVIILAYGQMSHEEAVEHEPKIVLVDDANRPVTSVTA